MSTPGRTRHRILFVDDELLVLNGLRRSLSSRRDVWDMDFVTDGRVALEQMDKAPYDGVVTDFRMPVMNGGELLRAVQERHPDTARLMLTGHTDSADLVKAVNVTHRFLDKPCDREVLIAAIEEGLELRDALAGQPVRSELGGLADLPFGSDALRRLDEVLGRPESSMREIAGVIESDVGLTITVLHLAGGSSPSSSGRCTSVVRAVEIVGRSALRALAVMHALSTPIRSDGVVSPAWLDQVNAHARLSAHIARRLVRPEDGDNAFCAAVIQEAGQLALAMCRPARMDEILTQAADRGDGLAGMERAEFGVSHADAGAYLLGLWGFPSLVLDAVGGHTGPVPAHHVGTLGLTEAVRVARAVAHHGVPGVCPPAGSDHRDDWINDPRCQVSSVPDPRAAIPEGQR